MTSELVTLTDVFLLIVFVTAAHFLIRLNIAVKAGVKE